MKYMDMIPEPKTIAGLFENWKNFEVAKMNSHFGKKVKVTIC